LFNSSNVVFGFLRSASGAFTTFSAPGAGTAPNQGTLPESINAAGAITGGYFKANVNHAFVRSAGGVITQFQAPGAGTAAGQGTVGLAINAAGAIAGYYVDPTNVIHAFLRTP
jgi:hypothetical protein